MARRRAAIPGRSMPFVLIAGGGIIAVLLGAIGISDVYRAHPAEFITGAASLAVIIAGGAVARLRASSRRVPLNPSPRQVTAAPRRAVILPPPAAPGAEGPRCEGPGCGWFLGDDPWRATVDSGPRAGEHLFCSRECLNAWQIDVIVPPPRR